MKMNEAKKIGRVKTTVEADMYFRVCDYDRYTLIDPNKEERVLYGVKHALYFLNPDTRETINKVEASTLVDASELNFNENGYKMATFEKYLRDKVLEVYKNEFVENDSGCCVKCGKTEGLHQVGTAVVYAKCKCDLQEFLSQEKCKK